MKSLVACFLIALALLFHAFPCEARTERFAVLLGNDRGDSGEVELRYAERDAARMYDALKDVGHFLPTDMVLLKGERSDVALRALVAMNDRIRSAVATPGTEVIFFVYYSGHADADALHLAGSDLDIPQIDQLVRGSAAQFRVLLVDACRSGALTHVKGGRPVPPFALSVDEQLANEGVVLLTASSASEDAQESDDLRGSFFTHYFVSALLGAADTNMDGKVTLHEAYQYSYENTIRATSRTWAGVQHPTFQYDLRGQGEVVIAEPNVPSMSRASILFPRGRAYLVMEKSDSGAVVAEASANAASRRIDVKPGRYFVRGRAPDVLLEGVVDAPAGTTTTVDEDHLNHIAYARLVRKGGSDVHLAQGPEAGYEIRSALPTTGLCQGLFASYPIAFAQVSLTPRVSACHSTFDNDYVTANADELGGELRLAHAWDLPVVSVDIGVALGGALLHEGFRAESSAPARSAGAFTTGASVGLSVDLGAGFFIASETSGMAYTYAVDHTDSGPTSSRSLSANFAFRQTLGVGKHWAH